MKNVVLALAGLAVFSSGSVLAAPSAGSVSPPVTNVGPTAPPPAIVSSARVVMLKIFVSDLDRGEKFYHEVFGTTAVQRMGDNVRILVFPGGATPGIIMIRSPDAASNHSSFVMQVSDYRVALDRAAANGGKLLNTRFAQEVGGLPARSSHFLDPDGNNVEVLQIGQPR
jgi:predicted enzyme related to lactoylglutathione lyase